jgi:hypothetical protein
VPFSRRGALLGPALKVIVAAYIVAFAALPFAHHDLACHLKSTTHCTICHVGTSGEDSAQAGPPPVHLADAGRAEESASPQATARAVIASSGRSPPSSPTSSL